MATRPVFFVTTPGESWVRVEEVSFQWFPGMSLAQKRRSIDAMQAALPEIDKFTLPGGHVAVSLCHVCRTVCRRAERAALRADQAAGVDASALVWLNRLSDYFYLLGRTLSAYWQVEEVLWIP